MVHGVTPSPLHLPSLNFLSAHLCSLLSPSEGLHSTLGYWLLLHLCAISEPAEDVSASSSKSLMNKLNHSQY